MRTFIILVSVLVLQITLAGRYLDRYPRILKEKCIAECWGVPSYFYSRDPDPYYEVQSPYSSLIDQEITDEEDVIDEDDCKDQEPKVSDCDQDKDIVLKTRQRKSSHGKRGKNKLLFTRMGRAGNNKLLFTRMGRASDRNETLSLLKNHLIHYL